MPRRYNIIITNIDKAGAIDILKNMKYKSLQQDPK